MRGLPEATAGDDTADPSVGAAAERTWSLPSALMKTTVSSFASPGEMNASGRSPRLESTARAWRDGSVSADALASVWSECHTSGDWSELNLTRTGSLLASSHRNIVTKVLHRLQWPSKKRSGVGGTLSW